MASAFTLEVTITQNVATALNSTRLPCNSFLVQADPSNGSVVWIGDSQVTVGTHGLRLEIPVAGSNLPFAAYGPSQGVNAINLADWYAISAGNGQKLHITYLQV